MALPLIMVAPNGARRGKHDHQKIPITIPEIVETAATCAGAGAGGIHLHVRDDEGRHTLDAGLYRELLTDLKQALPNMACQITTEAVGIYSPQDQRALVRNLRPESVSVSILEMYSDGDVDEANRFYRWCLEENIAVQHILYGPEDLQLLDRLLDHGELKPHRPQLLFVLGRYAKNQESSPEDLKPFTSWLTTKQIVLDWAVCAFGVGETKCLIAGHEAGGKIRVGFENSLWNADGSIAIDNAQRVATIASLIKHHC